MTVSTVAALNMREETSKQTTDGEEEEMERYGAIWNKTKRERGKVEQFCKLTEKKKGNSTLHINMVANTHSRAPFVFLQACTCRRDTSALTSIRAHAPAHSHCYFQYSRNEHRLT